jgi:hypothetical protein
MTTPTYDPNIPQFPDDSLSVSQPQFQRNFSTLFNAFAKNHVPLNSSNAGNHTLLELLERVNAQQTDPGEMSVYTKDVEGQTDQIFIRYQGNGTEFQVTNYQLYSIKGDDSVLKEYFTFLPGKIIIYFGVLLKPASTKGIIPLNPPVCTKILSASCCPIGSLQGPSKPIVETVVPKDGIISKIGLLPSTLGTSITLFPSQYYFVAGKI